MEEAPPRDGTLSCLVELLDFAGFGFGGKVAAVLRCGAGGVERDLNSLPSDGRGGTVDDVLPELR